MTKSDGHLILTEAQEIAWRNYLNDFEEQVLPIFTEKGYSKDVALHMWMTNRLYNQIDTMLEKLEE